MKETNLDIPSLVEPHYKNLLAGVYSWMYGGFDHGIKSNTIFFNKLGIKAEKTKLAVDLGAGCGFQSIPLARKGFSVLAIDTNKQLLKELERNRGNLDIRCIQDNLYKFEKYLEVSPELIVCMTDTLLLLESKAKIKSLLVKLYNALDIDGKAIISFRDLSCERFNENRIIPVKSDHSKVLTCFLEYEKEFVKVNDLLYTKNNGSWEFNSGFYIKHRISKSWIDKVMLEHVGVKHINSTIDNGVITIILTK